MKLKKISAFLTAMLLASTSIQAFATTTLPKAVMPTGAITITNNYVGTPDVITIDNTKFSVGDSLNITAGGSTQAVTIANATSTTSISIAQLGQAKGTISVSRYTPTTTVTGAAIKVAYAQEQSPAINATGSAITVSVQGNVDTGDVVTATGIAAGDKIVVYTSADLKSKVLGTSKVGTTTTASITLPTTIHESVTTPAGIYVSVIKTGATVSTPVLITNYTPPTTTPAIATTNILASSNAILVTGLSAGNTKVAADIITVYSSDPTGITDSKSLKAITLATGKVTKGNTYVFLTFKSGTATKIYVTKKSSNDVVTAPVVITLASTN